MRTAITDGLLLVGAVLILISAVGVVRFRDTMSRIHALSKASSFGLVLVLLGGAVTISGANDRSFLLLAIGFQLVTAPIAGHLLGRAVQRDRGSGGPPAA